jgi:hypothetical protein
MGNVKELQKLTRGQIDAALMQIGDQLGMGTAEGVMALLRGDIVVQPLDYEVYVDRSVNPDYGAMGYPSGMLDLPSMERHGPTFYTLKEKDFWDYSETGQTLLMVYQSLKQAGEIQNCLNLQDALALMRKPMLMRRLLGESKVLYFLGSVFMCPFQTKSIMVPVLEYFFSKFTSEHTVKLSVHHLEDVRVGDGKSLIAKHTS